MPLKKLLFENIMGKVESVVNRHFLLFPQCFLFNQITVSPFVHIFDLVSLFAAVFEEAEIRISGNRLTLSQTSPGFYVSAV